MENERLIIGSETSDDAAVYKLNDEIALVQTLDFLLLDDPYIFGQIAAANSLVMCCHGRKPLLAMNIVYFPECLNSEVLKQILKGSADKVVGAGALLVGGHSVKDEELKYGLSVTGIVHPEKY